MAKLEDGGSGGRGGGVEAFAVKRAVVKGRGEGVEADLRTVRRGGGVFIPCSTIHVKIIDT